MSFEPIRRGRAISKSALVDNMIKTMGGSTKLRKNSINGADGAFCPRKVVAQLNFDPKFTVPSAPSSTGYFAVGNAVHDMMRDTFKKMGILIVNEYNLRFAGLLHGYIDDIIIHPVSGKIHLIDGKTCGKLPLKPKPDHVAQMYSYMLTTGIYDASLVYFSRSVAKWDGLPLLKEFIIPVDEETIAHHRKVLATSLAMAKERVVIPRPDYRTSHSNCGWCPLKEMGCWSNNEGDLRDFVDAKFVDALDEDLLGKIRTWEDALVGQKHRLFDDTLRSIYRGKHTNKELLRKWIEENHPHLMVASEKP